MKRVNKAVNIATDALTQMERELNNVRNSKGNSTRVRIDFGTNLNVLDEAESILAECPLLEFEKDYLLKEVQSWCTPIDV